MAIFNTSDTTNKSGIDFKDTREYGDASKFKDLYSVDTKDTDGAQGFGETTYTPDFRKWNGYYKKVDIVAAIIDAKARWTVGDSFEADEATKTKLKKIKGFGKDTFNGIIYNLLRTSLICGDSFAEIIKDKAGRLINLKPLNSGSMQIVVDEYGIIKRYEQTAQIGVKGVITFDKDKIFHLPYNRIADEIHGIPDTEKCEDIVKKLKACIGQNSTIIERYIKPLTMYKVKTDDANEIQNFKSKIDNAFKQSENLIIPDETVADVVNVSISDKSIIDPLPFINSLKTDITKAMGVPDIILGYSENSTEASSKVSYVAFEQFIKFLQKWLEEQIEMQLGLELNFIAPASLDPAQAGGNPGNNNPKITTLSQDQTKDGGINAAK